MISLLIRNADGIFTGLPGGAMRATGAIGDLVPEGCERIIGATGCVVYPGLFSTHHHLSKASSRACVPASTSH